MSDFLGTFFLFWLMAMFLGIVAWVYWPKRKREIEEHGMIPLKDDEAES